MDICDDEPVFGKNTFSLHYRKLSNKDLFSSLEESELGIKTSKNYIPIYETYFNLNETNYNSINLNQRFYVSALSGVLDRNNIQAAVVDAFKSTSDSLTIVHKPIFIKFSPLIDPVKYMSGKYEPLNTNNQVLNIPTLSKLEKQGHSKANDRNNAAYVDGFFSYLSSQVLNCHDFIHGLNYYGSFNAIKGDFYYNVIDDIEYLSDNPFFNTNKGILFDVEDIEYSDDSDDGDDGNDGNDGGGNRDRKLNAKEKQIKDTRNRKPKINIDKLEDTSNDICDNICDDFAQISNELNTIFSDSSDLTNSINIIPLMDSVTIDTKNISDLSDIILNKELNSKNNSSNYSFTSGSCSSRSSYTNDDSTTGSDCDIDDTIISLDDNMVNVKQQSGGDKSNKKEKNNKYNNNDNNDEDDNDENSLNYDDNDNDKDDDSNEDDKEEYDDYDEDEDDEDDDETLWATIKDYPVLAIMLEKCDNTLDSLMMQEKEMTENEWKSALMQIIMTLITYQKLFGLLITTFIQITLCLYIQKRNIYIITLIRNITAFQPIIALLKLSILDEQFININLKLYVAIASVAQATQLHNIIANLILMIRSLV